MKMLASRAQGPSREGVTRMFVAFGLERPREVEPSDLPKTMGADPAPPQGALPADLKAKVTKGAPSRLLTLGGTVTATPVEMRVRDTLFKRIWLCEAIP